MKKSLWLVLMVMAAGTIVGMENTLTLSYYDSWLLEAAGRHTTTKAIEKYLSMGANINAQKSKGLMTPLHCAAKKGSRNVVKYLLDHGADKTIKNRAGETAYDVAVESVKKLLEPDTSEIKKESELHKTVVI